MTRVVSRFPRPVREIENLFIPLPDGCRLAARLWMPADADRDPVPAILEYLPYRKRDGTAARDALTHPYFAGHGYAAVRVDMRGNGDSDGLMWDEYLKQEQDDALAVIAWLRDQPWCTGRVGMIGISWGGFNGLQVAARAPEGLDAVVTIASTVDRYGDDIHYKGGCLLLENFGWSAVMQSYSSRPPDPAMVGTRWRDMWLERLNHQPLLIENWLAHQRRDSFWKHGSVAEDYGAIKAAVLTVGGWGDGYRNTMDHLVRNLTAPVKAIAGPWVHKYPHFAKPAPQIGFLQECLRWWGHWLKDRPTGVADDPAFRLYVMAGAPPRTDYTERSGRWIAETTWPSPAIARRHFHLADGALLDRPAANPAAATATLRSPHTTGLASGEYSSFGGAGEWPGDQRIDDAGSLVFDSAPLAEDIDIVGGANFTVTLASDRPQANLIVRLGDVAPDGAVTRITLGMLNLCHRGGHETPRPLTPGAAVTVAVPLDQMAYRLAAGHRLRLSLSTQYWPFIWPSPTAPTLTLEVAGAVLDLPVRDPGAPSPPVTFPPVETAPPQNLEVHRAASTRRQVRIDQVSGVTTLEVADDSGLATDRDTGLTTGAAVREVYTIHPDDPLSARVEIWRRQHLSRDGWRVETETHAQMTADADSFFITGDLRAFENGALVTTRDWRSRHRRDFV